MNGEFGLRPRFIAKSRQNYVFPMVLRVFPADYFAVCAVFSS